MLFSGSLGWVPGSLAERSFSMQSRSDFASVLRPSTVLSATLLAACFTSLSLGQIAPGSSGIGGKPNGPAPAGDTTTGEGGLVISPVVDPIVIEARRAFLEANPGAGIYDDEPVRGGRLSRVYGEAFSSGTDPVDSAERFLSAHGAMLSTDMSQLLPIGPNGDGTHVINLGYDPETDSFRFSLVGYTQYVNGIPVFRGDVRLLVRNEPGYPLVLVSNGLRDVRDFAANFIGKPVPPSKIDVRKISRRALNQFGPGAVVSEQEQVIWAGYDDAPASAPRLAYKFIVSGTGVFDRNLRQRMLYVVDAATNQILFQEDQILHGDVVATVQGQATQGTAADACNPEATTALPYAIVSVGATTYVADVNGVVTIPNASNQNLTITSNLTTAGRFFVVNNAPGAESSVSTSATGGAVTLVHSASNSVEAERSQVNAYVQSNLVRDYLLAYNPTFPTIANQLSFPINVMVTGTCNAFYDGSSINFYPAGGGCNNTAFSVVVHHEYGHHIVNRAGSGQGAYGEGFGDVMGVLLVDESRLAVGFQNCSTGIRDANNTNQYSATGCSSAGSAIHTCGTLLSGAVWSTRTYLLASKPTQYRQIISNLAIDSVLLHTGTAITPAITIDFLTLDDNDANINNGTPNYTEINAGFSDHGMPGPAIAPLSITFPNGLPANSIPAGGTTFPVTVSASGSSPQPNSGRLFYRIGTTGSFVETVMATAGTNQYTASLPAAPCGSVIQYYVSALTTTGAAVRDPSDAPTTVHSAISSSGVSFPFVDTVETALGWTLSTTGDTATAGLWTRGDPLGTFNGSTAAQPENDVTVAPGVNCFFTGQGTAGGAIGEADVDGGFTTLTSPVMNASGTQAYVGYYRWYSNQQGASPNADTFRVQISSNNGSTWVPLETVGPTGSEVNGGWVFKEFRVADFVTPTAQVRIRFIAEDAGSGSLIEAAVDEVRIRTVLCAVPGDVTGDGVVNSADLGALLSGWGVGGASDLNGDGTTDSADLGILLANWT